MRGGIYISNSNALKKVSSKVFTDGNMMPTTNCGVEASKASMVELGEINDVPPTGDTTPEQGRLAVD